MVTDARERDRSDTVAVAPDDTIEQIAPADTIELSRVRKGKRELRCITKYLPTGIDLRLLEGDDFRRTQLCRDAPAVDDLSSAWQKGIGGEWLGARVAPVVDMV